MTRHSRTHFFKYCSANVVKLILARRKVRYSAPRIFNDPFDTQIDLRFPFTVDVLQNLTLRCIIDATRGNLALPNFGHNQNVAILEKLRQLRTQTTLSDAAVINLLKADIDEGIRNQIDDLPKLHADFRNEFLNTAIIYCVSEVSDDLLMWSHYSENHTGVVVKFRALQELDNAFCVATPIIYQEEMPELASIEEWVDFMLGFGKLDAQKMWAKMFSIKHIG